MTAPTLPEVAATAAAAGTATTLAEHGKALQSVLGDLSTLTVAQLVTFFRQNQTRSDFPVLLKQAVPKLVLPHAQAAATITAQWFDEIAPTKNFNAAPTVNVVTERIDKTVDWALYAPTDKKPPAEAQDVPTDQPSGLLLKPLPKEEPSTLPTWEENPDITLSRLAGSTKRMVYDASRDTVVTNAVTQGMRYARLAQPDACAFCRLLATRTHGSELYRSEGVQVDPETGNLITVVVGRSIGLTAADRRAVAAGLATEDELLERRKTYATGERKGQQKVRSLRGTRKHGDKYHDHCRCVAVPVPEGASYDPPDYAQQWQSDYNDAVEAARKAGRTKGQYGAIDVKAVLAEMRANTTAH